MVTDSNGMDFSRSISAVCSCRCNDHSELCSLGEASPERQTYEEKRQVF